MGGAGGKVEDMMPATPSCDLGSFAVESPRSHPGVTQESPMHPNRHATSLRWHPNYRQSGRETTQRCTH